MVDIRNTEKTLLSKIETLETSKIEGEKCHFELDALNDRWRIVVSSKEGVKEKRNRRRNDETISNLVRIKQNFGFLV